MKGSLKLRRQTFIMMRLFTSIILICLSCTIRSIGQIIHIPDDYPTIQQGIDAAASGDTVLVSPGFYQENLQFNGTNITLASHFIIANDTSFINSTILDGNHNSSVIRITADEDSTTRISGFCITNGGNIVSGGGIYISNADPVLDHLHVIENKALNGAGIYLDSSYAKIEYCNVCNNSTEIINLMEGQGGAGICISNSGSYVWILNTDICHNSTTSSGGGILNFGHLSLSKVNIIGNDAYSGGGLSLGNSYIWMDPVARCNIYSNRAGTGSDVYSEAHSAEIVVDTFTVMEPSQLQAYRRDNFTFDILNARFSKVDYDLYVSPDGDDSNSGQSPGDPLKTIHFAQTILDPSHDDQRNIFLLDGVYNLNTNGELFPVHLMDYTHLIGTADSLVILDADSSGRVLQIMHNDTNHVSGLTLKGGWDKIGAGLYVTYSDPCLEHLIITGNSASRIISKRGGGIFFDASHAYTDDIKVINNSAETKGGGIYAQAQGLVIQNSQVSGNICTDEGGGIFVASDLILDHVTIDGNMAFEGGGIYYDNYIHVFDSKVLSNTATLSGGGIYSTGSIHSQADLHGTTIAYNHADGAGGGIYWYFNNNNIFDSIDRCNIYMNTGGMGSDLYSWHPVHVVVDTFTVLNPTDYHAEFNELFTFDILNEKLDQIDSDVYVSSNGDDNNSGLTPDDPFKTIYRAYMGLRADKDHQNTVHLANGEYSSSSNGEFFPVRIVNYSSLEGESRENTIIDAEERTSVMGLYYDTAVNLRNFTITGGYGGPYSGGGLFCWYSPMNMDNLKIVENVGGGDGGGICIGASDQSILSNLIIEKNESGGKGGGISSEYSQLVLNNLDIKDNIALDGGGMYLSMSSDTLTLQMENVRVVSNEASNQGGGIFMGWNKNTTITNSVIDSNSAFKGGGIYMASSTAMVKNSLITNNSAIQGGGGIIIYYDYLQSPELESGFYNVTLANNDNVGLYCYSAGVNLVNSLFWDNSGQGQIYFYGFDTHDDTLSIKNSDIEGGINGIEVIGGAEFRWLTGNIDLDPVFLGDGSYPYALSDVSPCIDAGTIDTTGLNLPFNDLIGNTRIWDGDGDGSFIVDMGPYEYGAPVAVNEHGGLYRQDNADYLIYPNPASEHIVVHRGDINSTTQIEIYNSLGQLTYSSAIPNGQEQCIIPSGGLIPGLYTIKLVNDEGRFFTGKVLISE
jgi:predicted outer membrane repeat protein